MSKLSAQSIRRRCVSDGVTPVPRPLVAPFHERTRHAGKTFGLSACGYDVRVDQDLIIAPGACALASTMEYFDVPRDLSMDVYDKSSWARVFVALQNTTAEPGWRGYLTLEISNHSNEDVVLNRGDPIAQVVFFTLDEPTEQPYEGKYQNQRRGPQPVIDEVSWLDGRDNNGESTREGVDVAEAYARLSLYRRALCDVLTNTVGSKYFFFDRTRRLDDIRKIVKRAFGEL